MEKAAVYPANIFITTRDRMQQALRQIQDDMFKQVDFFKECGKYQEAKRLKDRVTYDLEMLQELGYCPGIENYSRYFDGRPPGQRPFCLLDYFPKDFLTIIDESHVTIPQIRAMFGGDHSRKQTLVEYGFRMPSAIDNRPLKFEEFEALVGQTVYVSATPTDYELEKCDGVIVEQLIRPTGLLDPVIEVRPNLNQIDDLLKDIDLQVRNNDRVLVTTLTKRMAEELTKYLSRVNIRCRYIHSDIDTLERIEIMEGLRNGTFDVLVGVNLLREGLDLPEVSLVAILDADKEGFLRSERSLIQTMGRAARHLNGRAILYADRATGSMDRAMAETDRRRARQIAHNKLHNITPVGVEKSVQDIMEGARRMPTRGKDKARKVAESRAAYSVEMAKLAPAALARKLRQLEVQMHEHAKNLEFEQAAALRDQLAEIKQLAFVS